MNHGLHFVDPIDPAVHTQTIENKNDQLKDMIRRRHGVVDQILPSLLKEFNWRERFGQRNIVFYNFIHANVKPLNYSYPNGSL
uniref:Transposase n=1 Tax=Acrobeloides nanus TaxID=290746 RepID=A0A914E9D0_9BILA